MHVIRPQPVHNFAEMASVTTHEDDGEHPQTITLVDDVVGIPPDAAAWIHSCLTAPNECPQDFLEKCALWFETQILAINVTSNEYTAELFYIYGLICTAIGNLTPVTVPAFAIGIHSPPLAPLRSVAALCAAPSATDSETALMLYHATIAHIEQWPEPKNVAADDTFAASFEQLFEVLVVFADDCLFPVTGDLYLHIVIGMHIPTWKGMMHPVVAYPLLAELYGDAANAVARPYMDNAISSLLRDRREFVPKDNAVLFILVTTLIAELEASREMAPTFNRGIVTRKNPKSAIPRPFVLCDMALPWLNGSDAYGFIDNKNTFHVCNGLGVAQATMAWLKECHKANGANAVNEFLLGTAKSTNPLAKYAAATKKTV